MRTYAHAWHAGYDTGRRWDKIAWILTPWWRGFKYFTAWVNGAARARADIAWNRDL